MLKQLDHVAARLADVSIHIEGPASVVAVLKATMANVPSSDGQSEPDVRIGVRYADDVWEIRSGSGKQELLPGKTPMPRLGGAAFSMAIGESAGLRGERLMRAAVVERNGGALALIGSDWETAMGLAAHLHSRGWSYVGTDNVFFDSGTGNVRGVQKALYVKASTLPQLPSRYRRAVEASPWYVTADGIVFYAVDPTLVGMPRTWTQSSSLRGAILTDGAFFDVPSLDRVSAERLREERLAGLDIDWERVAVAHLTMSCYIETCDLVERWFPLSQE